MELSVLICIHRLQRHSLPNQVFIKLRKCAIEVSVFICSGKEFHIWGPGDLRLLPSKHSSWWRRTEDVLKTSWRRLQCNIFLSSKTSWRRLEDIITRRLANTSWRRLENVFKMPCKTSWRRLEDVLGRRIADTSWRRLEDVFKASWKTKSVTLKTSSRRL